jgi:hypothetical protein
LALVGLAAPLAMVRRDLTLFSVALQVPAEDLVLLFLVLRLEMAVLAVALAVVTAALKLGEQEHLAKEITEVMVPLLTELPLNVTEVEEEVLVPLALTQQHRMVEMVVTELLHR